jgi:hypothetical protein
MRDRYEIGIEKEYAILGRDQKGIAYYLGAQQLLNTMEEIDSLSLKNLLAQGWRIVPEYSHALIEVVSPPFLLEQAGQLIEGFKCIEQALRRAIERVRTDLDFLDSIEITDSASAVTNRFLDRNGNETNEWEEILLQVESALPLREKLGSKVFQETKPQVFRSIKEPAQLFAGFISTHLTFHPVGVWECKEDSFEVCEDFACFFWQALGVALQFEEAQQKEDVFYLDGFASKKLESSPRDILLGWSDVKGQTIKLKTYEFLKNGMSGVTALEAFVEFFGNGPYTDMHFKSIAAYAARPRITQGKLMIEFRCFHSKTKASQVIEIGKRIACLLKHTNLSSASINSTHVVNKNRQFRE